MEIDVITGDRAFRKVSWRPGRETLTQNMLSQGPARHLEKPFVISSWRSGGSSYPLSPFLTLINYYPDVFRPHVQCLLDV